MYQERWGSMLQHKGWLPHHAKALNLRHLEATYGRRCPWGGGCNASTYEPFLGSGANAW